MKVCLFNYKGQYAETQFYLYLPYICWNKNWKTDIGGDYQQTMISLPTKINIISNRYIIDFMIRLLGIGFRLYMKEVQ